MSQASAQTSDADYDLIVIGAGGAGMAAALFGAIEGLKVLLVERSAHVGGTSALSAGAIWIPNTHLATGDTPENAALYLEHAVGARSPARMRAAFLSNGPRAVRSLEDHSDVRLRAFAYHPDYLSDLPGATTSGRVLECLPFDGRLLGADLALVRPPIPEFTVLGGMMVDRIDIGHLLNMTHSARSFAHSARLLLRHAGDRLRYKRGARLVLGNALIGRLLYSLRQRQVPIWLEASTRKLLNEGGRVTGVQVMHQGRECTLRARLGVVLAGGGFSDHPVLRKQMIAPEVEYSPRAGTSSGQLQQMAMALGARLGPVQGSAACWAPVSVRRRADGSMAVFPHFVLDRAKPGTVVVDANGQRFVNESTSYHLFGERMLARDEHGRCKATAWLIADHNALVKYGLGMVRPGARGLTAFLRDSYLLRASSIAELATQLHMPPHVLRATIDTMNSYAQTGVDAQFGRGSTLYQKNLGDAAVKPNPNLGPIAQAPYYALRLYPGDIAASTGLSTDEHARVLRDDGAAIAGLYAVGNEAQSVMGGAYPGPGINLGPAITFAYAAVQAAKTLAAEHAMPAAVNS